MSFYQQGDILIKSVDALPKSVVKQKSGIIKLGSQTGHSHMLDKGEVYLSDNKMYIVAKDSTIIHDEHKPIKLADGVYLIDEVLEYDHFLEESKAVID